VYDTYCGKAGIGNVKKRHFGAVRWIILILAGTVLNAVPFTVLTQSCSSATCGVRRCVNVVLLITVAFRNDVKKIVYFQACVFPNTSWSVKDMCDTIFFSVSQTNVQTVRNVSSVISW
jgi:hypothetical protein